MTAGLDGVVVRCVFSCFDGQDVSGGESSYEEAALVNGHGPSAPVFDIRSEVDASEAGPLLIAVETIDFGEGECPAVHFPVVDQKWHRFEFLA